MSRQILMTLIDFVSKATNWNCWLLFWQFSSTYQVLFASSRHARNWRRVDVTNYPWLCGPGQREHLREAGVRDTDSQAVTALCGHQVSQAWRQLWWWHREWGVSWLSTFLMPAANCHSGRSILSCIYLGILYIKNTYSIELKSDNQNFFFSYAFDFFACKILNNFFKCRWRQSR